MIGALKLLSDRLRGRGTAALTVPPMDGALRPNNRLEDAPAGIAAQAPDCLVLRDGQPLWAEAHRLMSIDGEVETFSGEITALAVSASGLLAVAIDGGGVRLGVHQVAGLADIGCITALAFENDAALWVAVGSTDNAIGAWKKDFLEKGASGRVLRYDLSSQRLKMVAERLSYPRGLFWTPAGLLVSESWTKRVIRLDASGQTTQLIDDLPGYPAGLAASRSGGFWLALFAPRSPLMELVLREPAYRRSMMEEVEPDYWIAPALTSGHSFLEPMQGGALKQMGVLKPWAPTRSYGLVVELNAQFIPVQSLHSRAGGRRHGVTSVLDIDGTLWATSKGGNEVLRITAKTGRAQ
jgi:hypothetical protein